MIARLALSLVEGLVLSSVEGALALAFQPETFSREPFEAHVRYLASDEMKGRDNGTEEGLRAAAYVADRFKEAGLKPGGSEGYAHDFTVRTSREVRGRNVVGLLPGEREDEIVVVAAHHDARGVVAGRVQNGADDNASGVAMVLELARAFARSKPRRSMLFVSFDAEEDGLIGSREFVKARLYPPESYVATFVFDLVGGDFFPWEKNRLYALGSEYSAELHDRVGRAAAEEKDLEVARSGVFLIEPAVGMARSDYHAFRAKRVPFVFFSTGTPWYYHTEHDDPGVINFDKLTKAARFVHRVIAGTVEDARRPVYRTPGPSKEDVAGMKSALEKVLENRDSVSIGEGEVAEARRLLEEIAGLKEPEARPLQQAMMLLFKVARAQKSQ